MRLVADRFVIEASANDDNGGCAIDLATARRVRLAIAAAGDTKEQQRWLIACDEQQRVRAPGDTQLVDFGRVGDAHRFEAWDDEAVIAPFQRDRDGVSIAVIERPSVAAVAAMFETEHERRPRVAAIWGPPGSGRRTIVASLAQIARRRGFIPIDATLIRRYGSLIGNRTLFIVDRGRPQSATPWLRVLLELPRAHVVLIVATEEVRGVDGFPIDRLAVDALIASARLESAATPQLTRIVRRAAEQAHGLPGRFVRVLWGMGSSARDAGAQRAPLSRVAEQAAVYGAESADPAVAIALDQGLEPRLHVWPAPGELSALRRRAGASMALIAEGRYAPGIRGLRQAIGALARRDAWTDASQGALALAAALLDRGRPREAQRVLDDAREWVSRGADPGALIDAAVIAGVAWTDLARLEEAERILSGAVTAVRQANDRGRMPIAATALSRCLFWRGQYGEALALVDVDEDQAPPIHAVRRLRALARAAIAHGDSARAMTALDEARTIAQGRSDPRLMGDVAYTAAFIRVAVGDLEGVDRETHDCTTHARAARQPVRTLAAQLVKAEADRRRGLLKQAAPLSHLFRLVGAAPPLAKIRFDLVRAMVQAPDDRSVLRRHQAATGLKALEVFTGSRARICGVTSGDPFLEEILGILHVCQHADDEIAVLKEVCARVRQHLHAATVAFAAARDRAQEILALDGPRMDCEIADRAIDARMPIAPHRIRERLDGAAPVQYGGAIIGALCARWTLGTSYELSRAGTVLSMAAAAAAPVLSSVLVKRAHASPRPVLDLLGVTPAIADLRRSIESAAAAPFPVLIEGESGSGKELVARAIHRCGPRRDRPFCTLNCAALPDDLVEAELFGHMRGSFTGAVADRPGVFEEAHGGTLFLDEVGELSLRAQAKLLRVIQEGELRRIGENLSRRVDVRIVCATNRNLRTEAEAGRFRQDLLYRLDVVRIVVPALRERREDVNVLVDHFWTEATRRLASRATLAADTRAALAGYDWPGNVRELQNVLAALAVRSPKRGVVQPAALPAHVACTVRPDAWRLESARRGFEEAFVRAALARSGGQRARAAAELGVTRQGLNKLMTRLGIE